jgi:ribose transport system ATP-binding protein
MVRHTTLTEIPVQEPILAIHSLSKRFGGEQALDDVSLTILPGEVHGLLGENGSGKSTLIKILAGFHAPDAGELKVNGLDVPLPLEPGMFRSLGLSFVHQDLGLIPALSVLENLRIGEIAASRRPYISWSRERRRAREMFTRFGGLELDLNMKVGHLLPVEQALLAIVRALAEVESGSDHGMRGKLLVLDEATVFLPRAGTDRLFTLLREIAASGASVLFVSHDLEEVQEITDRVSVLRDGRMVGTVATSAASASELVEMIIGRRLVKYVADRRDRRQDSVATKMTGVTGKLVRDVAFELHRGEVLGLTGLAGSGFEEVPYLLFGAQRADGGEVRLGATEWPLNAMTPGKALELGVALVPANRQRDGAIPSLSVADNVMLQVMGQYAPRVFLERKRMLRDAAVLCREFDVRPSDPSLPYASLSGGNQQKALLAKWLQTDPTLLVLHEPTQGVDVGARQQIFQVIREACRDDRAVLCASCDYDQLAGICDRVLVFGRGRIVSELVGDALSKERIIEQAYAAQGTRE